MIKTYNKYQFIDVAHSFGNVGMDVIQIGGVSGKDLDIVIVGPGKGGDCAVSNLVNFIKIIQIAFKDIRPFTVITRQDHMGYVPMNTPILHLLFYPTIEHLKDWEVPSFAANLLDTGLFLIGKKNRYTDIATSYLKLEEYIHISRFTYQYRSYGSLAASGAIYLSGIPTSVPRHLISRLFQYTLRFTLVEILRSANQISWAPDELAISLIKNYPLQKGLHKCLLAPIEYLNEIPHALFCKWHCELFALTELHDSLLKRDNAMFQEDLL